MLALALEKMGELYRAFQMYEKAYQLDPTDPELFLNLGLAAWKLKMYDGAEKLFRLYIEKKPDHPSGYNNLGAVLRDKGLFNEAIEVLRGAITRMPDKPNLWNTVGTVLAEQGEFDQARTFYDESLRLDPNFGRALHNIGFALNHTGDLAGAVEFYERAKQHAENENDRFEIEHALGLCRAGLGDLVKGWDSYETRHQPRFRTSTLFAIKAPSWKGEDLEGKNLLFLGEQGLGDEIMFAGMAADLQKRVGRKGNLLIAVEKRLVPLFKRSFPDAICGSHSGFKHNAKAVRVVSWAKNEIAPHYFVPMGSALKWLRRSIEDFDGQQAFLKPDPERVAFWRERLKRLGDKPVVGICWRSMLMTTARKKYYSPLDTWATVLRNENVTFLNLQYGDCTTDLAYARDRLGLTIHHFDDIDLKNDLDDAAALSAACDLMISAPTAAAALAASVGCETWFAVAGRVWPQLGTDHYPWYPKTRVFSPTQFGDWKDTMAQVATALASRSGARVAA
jgi:Flp pilus assembly protein TadD